MNQILIYNTGDYVMTTANPKCIPVQNKNDER